MLSVFQLVLSKHVLHPLGSVRTKHLPSPEVLHLPVSLYLIRWSHSLLVQSMHILEAWAGSHKHKARLFGYILNIYIYIKF